MTPAPPRVRIKRRRNLDGDLLPGWWVLWANGRRCTHSTHADALRCLAGALTS